MCWLEPCRDTRTIIKMKYIKGMKMKIRMPMLTIAAAMLVSGVASAAPLPLYEIGTGTYGDTVTNPGDSTNTYDYFRAATSGATFSLDAAGFSLDSAAVGTTYLFGVSASPSPVIPYPAGEGFNMNDGLFSGLSVDITNNTDYSVDFGIYVFTNEFYDICTGSSEDCGPKPDPIMGAWQNSLIPESIATGMSSTVTFDYSSFFDRDGTSASVFEADPSKVQFSGVFSYGIYAVVSEPALPRPPSGVVEPSVLLMFGAGLLALGYTSRRKKV